MNVYIISDVVVFGIICLYIWRGRVDGFIKSFFHTFAYLGAAICARMFSKPVSNWLAEKLLYNKIHEKVREIVTSLNVKEGINELTKAVSEKFSGIIRLFNIDLDGIASSAIANQENAVEKMVEKISSSLSFGISNVLSLILVVVVALFIFKLVARVLDTVAKLPVLNLINNTGGIIFGALKGLLVCWLLVQIGVRAIVILMPELHFSVEKTYLINFLYNIFSLNFFNIS